MTREEAINILDPETRRETMKQIPVFERIAVDQEACRLAVVALRAQQEPVKVDRSRWNGRGCCDEKGCKTCKGVRTAIQLPETPNAPLTLEELREMDGEPVWLTVPGEAGGEWALIRNIKIDDDILIFVPLGAKRQYGENGAGTMGDYGKTWLAYRRKLEEGTA